MDKKQLQKLAGIPLTEGVKSKFEDSTDFTEEFDRVVESLKSKRWADWMKITDENYPTKAKYALKNVIAAIELLEAEIEKADKG